MRELISRLFVNFSNYYDLIIILAIQIKSHFLSGLREIIQLRLQIFK